MVELKESSSKVKLVSERGSKDLLTVKYRGSENYTCSKSWREMPIC